jgi:DNA-binding MarR family transcriptional regulator
VAPEDASRLRRVVSKLARELNSSAEAAELTPTQASVLSVVVARSPLPLAELADIEGLNPTLVSRVVRRLTDAGLVRRLPGRVDQRTATVEATAAGREVNSRIRAARDAIVSACVARLPEADADAISAALGALEALVQELHASRRERDRPA